MLRENGYNKPSTASLDSGTLLVASAAESIAVEEAQVLLPALHCWVTYLRMVAHPAPNTTEEPAAFFCSFAAAFCAAFSAFCLRLASALARCSGVRWLSSAASGFPTPPLPLPLPLASALAFFSAISSLARLAVASAAASTSLTAFKEEYSSVPSWAPNPVSASIAAGTPSTPPRSESIVGISGLPRIPCTAFSLAPDAAESDRRHAVRLLVKSNACDASTT
mmetsp:Transcript_32480/g.54333  ORF Transcript_32480/g.54333 Transcript_32480/m.54333 type:complete len:222 (-) Transcript_32480:865-1530(-)